ncbi:MAG: carboxypeptidase regulatory-like domain-containing protein [Enhygromyxa sp.]
MVRPSVWALASLLVIAGCRAGKHKDKDKDKDKTDDAPAIAVPRPAGTIAGEVRASGEPLADAQVCARKELPILDSVREDLESICGRSDASGRFDLSLGPGVYFVVASAQQHRPRGEQVVLRAAEPGVVRSFELLPGGREYAGEVVDLDGEPVAGAKVSFVTLLDNRWYPAVEVETDVQGRYRLWSARVGRLEVAASGYMDRALSERGGARLLLLPESSVAGVVVDREGRPVADARVSAESGFGPVGGMPENSVRSDAQGRFVLDQLRPDGYRLAAIGPDREVGVKAQIHLGYAERREQVVLTLDTDLHRYRAQIVDAETGAPVAGCEVDFEDGDQAYYLRGRVDEQGGLDVPLDSPGRRLERLRCPGYVARRPLPELTPASTTVPRVEVDRGVALHGIVVDRQSREPVAGLQVTMHPDELGVWDLTWSDEDTTDALGRFTITGLASGKYRLDVHPPQRRWGLEQQELIIDEAPVQRVTVEIPSAGRIEVEVGPERAGQWAHVAACTGPHVDQDRGGWVEFDGRAILEWVPTGSYWVSVGDPPIERCGAESVPVTVSAGETSRVRVEASSSSPSVSVRVLSSTGTPVARAVVQVDDPHTSVTSDAWALSSDMTKVALTDAEGLATLSAHAGSPFARVRGPHGLGRFNVVAVRPGQFGAREVDAEAAAGEIVIRLEPIE